MWTMDNPCTLLDLNAELTFNTHHPPTAPRGRTDAGVRAVSSLPALTTLHLRPQGDGRWRSPRDSVVHIRGALAVREAEEEPPVCVAQFLGDGHAIVLQVAKVLFPHPRLLAHARDLHRF